MTTLKIFTIYMSNNPPSLQFIERRLAALEKRHLYRRLKTVSGGVNPWLEIEGRRSLNLSSNNYLGLATHPKVQSAAATTVEQGGGAGASRLITGTFDLHRQLETRLAHFKQAEAALLFNSGYTANIGIIAALVGPGDVVLGDELNHASLIDGCRLSRAEFQSYPHCDLTVLEEQLAQAQQAGRRRKLVVTDTVFSMDGDIAPLAEITDLCHRYEAMLFVDEAHATGCLGPGGRGLVAQLGLKEGITLSMGTFSKALGGFGAFATGDNLVIEYLINTARSFIFTTALPPAVVATGLAALDVLEQEPQIVEQLQNLGTYFRTGLQNLGFDTLTSATHIVPVLVGESDKTLEMATALQEEGVYVVAIRPPTVPLGSARLRASVMASHTEDDLTFALKAFGKVGRQLGVI